MEGGLDEGHGGLGEVDFVKVEAFAAQAAGIDEGGVDGEDGDGVGPGGAGEGVVEGAGGDGALADGAGDGEGGVVGEAVGGGDGGPEGDAAAAGAEVEGEGEVALCDGAGDLGDGAALEAGLLDDVAAAVDLAEGEEEMVLLADDGAEGGFELAAAGMGGVGKVEGEVGAEAVALEACGLALGAAGPLGLEDVLPGEDGGVGVAEADDARGHGEKAGGRGAGGASGRIRWRGFRAGR